MSAVGGGHTLAIEASTAIGSVALLLGADVILDREVEMRGREEERLLPAVAECVSGLRGGLDDVERVVCGSGPGSFTSLRIAAAIAKGICHARAIPLFAVSSLALIVAGSPVARTPGRYIASIDAMRDESFAAEFDIDVEGSVFPSAPVRVVSRSALEEEAATAGAVLLDGAPRAASVAAMLAAIIARGAVDLATWEPDYGRNAEAQVKWEAAHGRPLPK